MREATYGLARSRFGTASCLEMNSLHAALECLADWMGTLTNSFVDAVWRKDCAAHPLLGRVLSQLGGSDALSAGPPMA